MKEGLITTRSSSARFPNCAARSSSFWARPLRSSRRRNTLHFSSCISPEKTQTRPPLPILLCFTIFRRRLLGKKYSPTSAIFPCQSFVRYSWSQPVLVVERLRQDLENPRVAFFVFAYAHKIIGQLAPQLGRLLRQHNHPLVTETGVNP